jgi:HSP20 family protein
MALIRWTPGREIVGIQDEMNRMFDSFFGMPRRVENDDRALYWTPRVNVDETDAQFEVTAELPGLNKEDVKIEVKDHVLTFTGEKKIEKDKKDRNVHIYERGYGKFCRTFTLPDNVDVDKIGAEFEDGILHIDIPKTEEAKPRQIEVQVK